MKKMTLQQYRIFVCLAFITIVLTGCDRSHSAGETHTSSETFETLTDEDLEYSVPPVTSELSKSESEMNGFPEKDININQGTLATEALPSDYDLVCVRDYIPDIIVELKYATEDNFTGLAIYDFSDAYLRYGTVQKLSQVQEELKELDMGLKIWDAFRPVSAQFRLWEVYPDATYVANPNTGFSSHSRGNTIDVTLVDSEGVEMHMPTGFDDFTLKADRVYTDCDEISAKNAELLQTLMEKHGFKPYSGEWWHFSDSTSYEVEDSYVPPTS